MSVFSYQRPDRTTTRFVKNERVQNIITLGNFHVWHLDQLNQGAEFGEQNKTRRRRTFDD